RVDGLPSGSRGPVDIDAEVAVREIDLVGSVRLREGEDTGGRGVDPALRFRHRDALDPVDAALELRPPVHALLGGLEGEGELANSAQLRVRRVEDLRRPAA